MADLFEELMTIHKESSDHSTSSLALRAASRLAVMRQAITLAIPVVGAAACDPNLRSFARETRTKVHTRLQEAINE